MKQKRVDRAGTESADVEREQVKDALKDIEEILRSLFDQAGITIRVSKAVTTVMVNPAYLDMFGWSDNSEVVGKPPH